MSRQIREVRVIDLFLYLLLPLAGICAETAVCVILILRLPQLHPIIFIAPMLIPFYFSLKYFVIGTVLAYKAFAPVSVRDRCRFEPCCSTYMVIAIKKYGLFRGVYKGVRRILRCKPPNGGVDFP